MNDFEYTRQLIKKTIQNYGEQQINLSSEVAQENLLRDIMDDVSYLAAILYLMEENEKAAERIYNDIISIYRENLQ